jgi:SAM-dependent methyltransferase
MTAFWDERYRQPEFAYGTQPNTFFAEQLALLPTGKILLPAEGEGRNAVFAAQEGWQVSAFDQSVEGQRKANEWATEKGVRIDYLVNAFENLPYQPGQFDALGLIFAHFQAADKMAYYQTLATFLRPGGTVILEAFSKQNLEYVARNPKVGGPRDVGTLWSVEEVQEAFPDFEAVYLQQEEAELAEGLYHIGVGSVVRFVGRKK